MRQLTIFQCCNPDIIIVTKILAGRSCNTEKELSTNLSLGDASYGNKDNFVVYSKTSLSGHSEKQTHSLQRTMWQSRIENPVYVIY